MPESPGYEPRDISIRLVIWAAVGTLALVVVVLVALWFSLAPAGGAPPLTAPGFFAGEQRAPGEPPLQGNPVEDLQRREEFARRRLDSYGWVDGQRGIVHIPIDRAMALYVKRQREKTEAAQ